MVDVQAFEAKYAEMCREMEEQGKDYRPPYPVFWAKGEPSTATKLLTYKLNAKNSRNVMYDPAKRTCRSYYKCEGCQRVMASASALGGHLSRCPMKVEHYEIISKLELAARSRRCRQMEKEGFAVKPKVKLEAREDEGSGDEAYETRVRGTARRRPIRKDSQRYQFVPLHRYLFIETGQHPRSPQRDRSLLPRRPPLTSMGTT